eukprot:COSAG01_NODE_151_length_23939_cov_24.482802_11_plen_51_part_00
MQWASSFSICCDKYYHMGLSKYIQCDLLGLIMSPFAYPGRPLYCESLPMP